MKIIWRLALAICAPLTIVQPAFASCSFGAFTGAEDNVMRAYVAYYGRPADSSGLAYWASRMDGSTINGNTASDGSAFVNFGTVNLRNSIVSGTCNNHATVNNQGGNTIGCSL